MFGKLVAEVRQDLAAPRRYTKVTSKDKYFDVKGWRNWLSFVRDFYKNYHFPSRSTTAPVFIDKNPDNRPYIKVRLLDNDIVALLDSGANASIIGSEGVNVIPLCKLRILPSVSKQIVTADGTRQKIIGTVDLPIFVNNKFRILKALVVPSVTHSFILGSDFCRKFNIRMDFKQNTWEITDDEGSELCMVRAENNCAVSGDVCNRHDFTSSQLKQIDSIESLFKNLNRDGKLSRTNKLVHHIETADAKPIKQRQYLLSPYMLGHLNKELDRMLELGVVEPSESAWSSPVLLVKKKDGSYRFCFDGRKLNSVTQKDSYPLPFVDRILNMLRDARFISSIDLRSAFWQIPLDRNSKEKTAFAVPGRGLFQFTVLPFGLSNAAQVQQRLMDAVFGPELEPHIFVYLDDIIITSKTFEEHIILLREVARRLDNANLSVNISKCEFFRKSLKYLGFVVDELGLRTDPDKVAAMLNFPQPINTTEIKRFVGMCSWYRRFVPHFSSLIAPINDLLKGKKKGEKVLWSEEAGVAFDKIKQALVSAPILSSPDFSKKFCIQCDASDVGLGGVLTQVQGVEEKVIAFASRTLSKAERNYSVTERECLAVVFGIDKFRPYIEGVKFTVMTDHYSLLWLNRMKDPTGKLARWSVKLQQFDFDLRHRKGKFNVVPDALSRSPLDSEVNVVEDNIALAIDLPIDDKYYSEMRENILKDPDSYPQWLVRDGYVFKYVPSRISLKSNISDWKYLVPKNQRKQILKFCHDEPIAAHLGYAKTLARVTISYYWPSMRRDIHRYVKSCAVCGAQKAPCIARAGFMGKQKNVSFPWQVISIDIVGPLPRSSKGFSFILVVTDVFTKFTLIHPMRKALASTIARFVENDVFLVYGVPQYILSDNGKQFVSSTFKDLCHEYKVQKLLYTALYHPQANPVERYNRTINTAIRSYVNEDHKKWDAEIPKIAFALRTAVSEVTGFSPAFLNFGRVVPCRGDYYKSFCEVKNAEMSCADPKSYAQDLGKLRDIYDDIKKRLSAAHERNAKAYNLRKRDIEFFVGDLVWRRNKVLSNAAHDFASKLAPRYVLCKVKKKISKLVYALVDRDGSNVGRWHIKDLKPYHEYQD